MAGSLRDLVGQRSASYRFPIEEGKLLEFARAVKATDPLYTDPQAAKAAGLRGLLAMPTFTTASAHWATEESKLDLGLDLRRVLAGGGEWKYLAPICAGDELTVTMSVESVEEKQGSRGPMAVIRVRTDFERGSELVQTYTSNIIQFGKVEEE